MKSSDAGGVGSATREAIGTGNFRDAIAERRREKFVAMAVFFVERSNGQKGVDALVHGFAYTDQDAGRERDTEFAGFFDSAKTKRGHFVRSFGMRQAVTHEARADVFEHQADAGVGILQAL